MLLEINNSLVQFYFHETDVNYIYSELSLFKLFIARNEFSIAHYHLQKAEKRAITINDFLLLDVIYSEFVQLSTYYGNTKPTVYLQKRSDNNKQLTAIRMLDEALTIMLYELDRNQTFGQSNTQTTKQLNTAIKRFESQKEYNNNTAFKAKLFLAVSQLLISKKDFKTLEAYTIKVFTEFSSKKYFTKSNHDIKLQMLRYICNALFINKKHTEALNYCKLFYTAIKEHNKLLYDKNIFFYYNALANNYSALDPQKAVSVLNEAKKNKAIINHPSHLGFVYFNLAGAYFELKQPKIALKNILSIINHPVFNNLSSEFKIQILIFEILHRIELKDLDYALKQINILLKTYRIFLILPDFTLENELLRLLKLLILKHNFMKNKISEKLVLNFDSYIKSKTSKIFVNYSKWLKEHLIQN